MLAFIPRIIEKTHFTHLSTDLVRELTEKTKKYDTKDASLWLVRVSIASTHSQDLTL